MPLVVFLALAAAPLPLPNPKRDPAAVLRQLEGLWEVTAHEMAGGVKLPGGPRLYVRIEAGTWSLQQEQPDGSLSRLNHLTLVLDPKKKPGWFDFKNKTDDANLYLAGAYEVVSHEVVRVVYASTGDPAARPKESSATKPNEYLMVLRRAPKR